MSAEFFLWWSSVSCCEHCPDWTNIDFEILSRISVLIQWRNSKHKWSSCDRNSLPANIVKINLEHPQQCSVCEPAKIFLISKFTFVYFFATSPWGTVKRGRILLANYLDWSLWLANQKQGAPVRSYLLHSSPAASGNSKLACIPKYYEVELSCCKHCPD
jgi:hypothetical protein